MADNLPTYQKIEDLIPIVPIQGYGALLRQSPFVKTGSGLLIPDSNRIELNGLLAIMSGYVECQGQMDASFGNAPSNQYMMRYRPEDEMGIISVLTMGGPNSQVLANLLYANRMPGKNDPKQNGNQSPPSRVTLYGQLREQGYLSLLITGIEANGNFILNPPKPKLQFPGMPLPQ